MSRTSIEWCARPGTVPRTWNPLRGCSRVSSGCDYCYAAKIAARFSDDAFKGFARRTNNGVGAWTGRVELIEHKLHEPKSWRDPSTVFVNSMSDLFHEGLDYSEIAAVFMEMLETPQHTYIVVTKRAERMRDFLTYDPNGKMRVHSPAHSVVIRQWPAPHIWLIVSCENQQTANERVPHLLATPASIRGVSCEPLLGPIDLEDLVIDDGRPGEWHASALDCDVCPEDDEPFGGATLDWVIAGGESGPRSRPCDEDWLRSLRDQCSAEGVAFFLKQLGGYPNKHGGSKALLEGKLHHAFPSVVHERDEDCAPYVAGRTNVECPLCGTYWPDHACDSCGGRAFHTAGCTAE